MRDPDVLRSNRRALCLVILGIVLSMILLSMPLYSFNANVYTKKSPNTFVGDEKYQAVRAGGGRVPRPGLLVRDQ